MAQYTRIEISAKNVSSLTWWDDTLIDWTGDMGSYSLDGTFTRFNRHIGYKFDASIMSPSGRFEVVYERTGTKAILLERGQHLRELDRSY